MRTLYISLCLLISVVVVGQAPMNDNCIDAEELTDLENNCAFRPYMNATFDFMSPECGDDSLDNIWYKFTARGTALEIDAQLFDGRDVFIQVFEFNGSPCDSSGALLIACDTNSLVRGQLLNLDDEYYISVSADDGVSSDMIVCVNNPLINTDPLNDNICNATSVSIDSSCRFGTLENATYDFPNPACPIADERSVWFKGMLPPNANAMKIVLEPLGLDTFPYEVGLFKLQNGTNCVDPPIFISGFCSQGKDTLTVLGLEPGERYHIMVSSEELNAHTFSLCLLPIIPPPGCALNDLCTTAENIPLNVEDSELCIEGCNIGASIGPVDTTEICTQFTKPTVFYKVYVDSSMDRIDLRMFGMNLVVPQLAVYYGDCNDLNYVICDFGSNGILNFSFDPPVKDTTYYIVASDISGSTGDFNLCIDASKRLFQCNYENNLEVISTSLGSPLDGPYKAGEELLFRYTLEDWIPTECNWLQGIVPVFISGWDPTSFTPDGRIKAIYSNPSAIADGEWGWYSSGDVHYNFNNPVKGFDEGELISPGWFFLEEGETELDSSRGDGLNCSDSLNLEWSVEFSVRIVPYPGCVEDTIYNALMEFKTFSDGEIGDNKPPACNQDLTTQFSVPFECCSGPQLSGRTDTICSGETINYSLSQSDTISSFIWTVIPNFRVDGESGTTGPNLTQTLINNSTQPQTIEYTVYAEDTLGCYGPPAHYDITVLPELHVNAGPDTVTLCRGERFRLGSEPTARGGTEPYRYFWSDMNLTGPNPEFNVEDSTVITLQVRDGANCVSRDTVNLYSTESPRAVVKDTVNVCRGDSLTVGFPLQGTPPFTYNLSFNGNYTGRDTTMNDYISFNINPTDNIHVKVDSLEDAICVTEVENEFDIILRDSISESITSTICGDEVYFIGNEGFDETGTYEVNLPNSSQYGCDSTVILNLTVNEIIEVKDTSINYNEERDSGSIEIVVGGGVAPYQYDWSNGDTTKNITNLESGEYTLTITDSEDCTREFTFIIGNPTSVQSIEKTDYTLFPQPVQASNIVTLDISNLNKGKYNLSIYSTSGQLVMQEEVVYNSDDGISWSLKDQGVYYWKIENKGKVVLAGKCIVVN